MPRVTLRSVLPVAVAFAAVYFASYLGTWEQALQTICSHPGATRPTLLLLGDSLTEQGVDPDKSGWVALLQNRYQRSADVLARGLSGYNTKWFIEFALPVIERELSSGGISPSLITLWLGANDAALTDGPSSRQHVPVDTYASNLEEIILTLRASAPSANLLVITPPHVDDADLQDRATRPIERHGGRIRHGVRCHSRETRSCSAGLALSIQLNATSRTSDGAGGRAALVGLGEPTPGSAAKSEDCRRVSFVGDPLAGASDPQLGSAPMIKWILSRVGCRHSHRQQRESTLCSNDSHVLRCELGLQSCLLSNRVLCQRCKPIETLSSFTG